MVVSVLFVCFSDVWSVKRPLEGLLVAWGVLGRFFGVFGSSWAVLGASLVDFWGPGSQVKK